MNLRTSSFYMINNIDYQCYKIIMNKYYYPYRLRCIIICILGPFAENFAKRLRPCLKPRRGHFRIVLLNIFLINVVNR